MICGDVLCEGGRGRCGLVPRYPEEPCVLQPPRHVLPSPSKLEIADGTR